MSKPKPADDTAELVAQARAFSQQFGSLLKVAGMLDEVGSLRQELEDLKGQREKAMAELSVLWGERDDELRALTSEIESRIRGEHQEAERALAQEAAARRSFENLKEEIANSHRVLTGLQAQVFRAEAQYSDLTTKLGALRGAIPVGA